MRDWNEAPTKSYRMLKRGDSMMAILDSIRTQEALERVALRVELEAIPSNNSPRISSGIRVRAFTKAFQREDLVRPRDKTLLRL